MPLKNIILELSATMTMHDTLPQQIANQLRRDILSGTLKPGATLKEREQALARNVSRTPMREAIRILAKEGLINLRPARSPIIANPSLEEITNDIDVLRALELLSGDLACERATASDLAEIRSLHEEIEQKYDHLDRIDVFEIDMRFHVAIIRAAHNASLLETHSSYLRRLWRVRYLSSAQRNSGNRVMRQHGGIIDGLERGDKRAVRRVIAAHIDAVQDNIANDFHGRTGQPTQCAARDEQNMPSKVAELD